MIVSRYYNYVFISVPKTGTHSLYDVLTEHFKGKRVGGYHHTVIPEQFNGAFKFHTTRNPYHKFCSMWSILNNKETIHNRQIEDIMGRPLELRPFVEWIIKERNNLIAYSRNGLKLANLMLPTSFYINTKLHEHKIDEFIRIENASQEFNNKLPFVEKFVDIPKLFSMQTEFGYKNWSILKTPEVTEMLNEWGADDFEAYGYFKES